jgi:chromosomal replication initiator protein
VTESTTRFVILPENRSAVLAVRRLQEQASPSQLYLHANSGFGKTHLAEWLARQEPSTTGSCLTAREWALEYLALPGCEEAPLPKRYRELEWLILEDVQYLPREASDRLGLLLDQRRRRRLKTLITGNVAPTDLELSSRLIGRIQGGLVVSIRNLGLKSRLRLLSNFAKQERIYLSDASLIWLAEQVDSPRAILGQIQRLRMISQIIPPPIDLDLLQLHWQEPKAPSTELTLERIAAVISKRFRVSLKQLRGPSRQRNILWPRQLAMYLARERTKSSLVEIGAYFGGRDHTTVLNALEKVRSTLEDHPQSRLDVEALV